MDASFKLYILSSNGPEVDVDAVNIYKDDKDKNGYAIINNKNISLDILEVFHLRGYVCSIKGVGNSDKNNLKLWKVIGIKSKDIKEQNISTEEDIVQKLRGKEMELEEPFSTYFQDELDNKNKSGSSIITIIPATGPSQQGVPQVFQKDDLKEIIRSAVREELSKKNPEVISASKLSDIKMKQIMNKIGIRTIVLCANDFKSLNPIPCSPFEWDENKDEPSQMKEVVKWFENVLKLPRDCQVKDVHAQTKNQIHLEGANTIIKGGGDISIGPSATSVIWIETKIKLTDFKESQAMGELFLIDKLHPTHSMTVLTDCGDNWILYLFLEVDNEQTIAVCKINDRGVALAVIKQVVLEETNRLNGWIGKAGVYTTTSVPPLLHKTKFFERIEINEDIRMSEIIDDLSEQELFNMDIRNGLRMLRDYVGLEEQQQVDQYISHFNDDYENSMFV